MVYCWECGMRYKISKEEYGEIQIFDAEKGVWTEECPNCGNFGFQEDESYDEDEYDEDNYDESSEEF